MQIHRSVCALSYAMFGEVKAELGVTACSVTNSFACHQNQINSITISELQIHKVTSMSMQHDQRVAHAHPLKL